MSTWGGGRTNETDCESATSVSQRRLAVTAETPSLVEKRNLVLRFSTRLLRARWAGADPSEAYANMCSS